MSSSELCRLQELSPNYCMSGLSFLGQCTEYLLIHHLSCSADGRGSQKSVARGEAQQSGRSFKHIACYIQITCAPARYSQNSLNEHTYKRINRPKRTKVLAMDHFSVETMFTFRIIGYSDSRTKIWVNLFEKNVISLHNRTIVRLARDREP